MYLWSALGLLLEEIIFLLCTKIPTLRKANNIFLLCPVSYFAHRQFRNRTVQSRNSYFVRQSENSYFAQVQFRNCTNSYSAQNIYTQQKKLRKMCSSAYCNKSRKKLEIQIILCYKVSFYLSNEVSFELVALAVAGKNNVKVD